MQFVLIVGYVFVGAALIAAIVSIGFLLGAFFGAPFVPTGRENVVRMLALAEGRPGERMVDIGSGDGRLLIAFARRGIEAHGYEINPVLAWWSRFRIARVGLSDRAFVHLGDFRKADLSPYGVVTVFGVDYMMQPLGEKLMRELAPGARVVSNGFTVPGWDVVAKRGAIMLYVPKEGEE